MIKETNAVAFRQNLGEMLNQVQYRRDSILISKDGKPVAALVDARLFERIRRMQARFDALAARLASAYAEVPVDVGLAEIDAAVRAERRAGVREATPAYRNVTVRKAAKAVKPGRKAAITRTGRRARGKKA